MNKPLLLRLHRWITLIFSLPLAVLIVTGLVLSFEPIVAGRAAGPTAMTVDAIESVLATHDSAGQARALFVRPYDGSVTIAGAQRSVMTHVDVASNAQIASPGALATLFGTSRRLHETFMLQLGWLVTASTAAMIGLIGLGVLMGWPRLRNSVSGWHKGTAWILLPLVVLSPLTGLFMAFGISLASPPPVADRQAAPVPLTEAVRIVAAEHDLSDVSWIRQRGNTLMTRIDDGGEMRVFTIARDGLHALPQNWPRLIHEGNWSGMLSAGLNVVTSVAMILLFATGMVLWGRRSFRQRRPRPDRGSRSQRALTSLPG